MLGLLDWTRLGPACRLKGMQSLGQAVLMTEGRNKKGRAKSPKYIENFCSDNLHHAHILISLVKASLSAKPWGITYSAYRKP